MRFWSESLRCEFTKPYYMHCHGRAFLVLCGRCRISEVLVISYHLFPVSIQIGICAA